MMDREPISRSWHKCLIVCIWTVRQPKQELMC